MNPDINPTANTANLTAEQAAQAAANAAAAAAKYAARAAQACIEGLLSPEAMFSYLEEEAVKAVNRLADYHASDRNLALAEMAVTAIHKMGM